MATIDPNSVLEAVLAYAGTTVQGSAFAAVEYLRPLVDLGVLIPDGHVREVSCSVCHEDHSAQVVLTDHGLRAICDRVGLAFEPKVNLGAFRVHVAPILELISANLDRPRRWAKPGQTPFLWSLGSFPFRGCRIGVYFALIVSDPQRIFDTIEWLRGEPRQDAVAVLTSGHGELNRIEMLQPGRVVRLIDYISWNDQGSPTLDLETLARHVLPEALQSSVRGGRPGEKFQMAEQLIEILDANGSLRKLPSARSRHRALQSAARARFGENVTLTRGPCDRAWLKYVTRIPPKVPSP